MNSKQNPQVRRLYDLAVLIVRKHGFADKTLNKHEVKKYKDKKIIVVFMHEPGAKNDVVHIYIRTGWFSKEKVFEARPWTDSYGSYDYHVSSVFREGQWINHFTPLGEEIENAEKEKREAFLRKQEEERERALQKIQQSNNFKPINDSSIFK